MAVPGRFSAKSGIVRNLPPRLGEHTARLESGSSFQQKHLDKARGQFKGMEDLTDQPIEHLRAALEKEVGQEHGNRAALDGIVGARASGSEPRPS